MIDRVPADKIEDIVGAKRHKRWHIGRIVSKTNTFYILHPKDCVRRHFDLTLCTYSQSLDRGKIVHEGFDRNTDKAMYIRLNEDTCIEVKGDVPEEELRGKK